jgi:hypothetical protein
MSSSTDFDFVDFGGGALPGGRFPPCETGDGFGETSPFIP